MYAGVHPPLFTKDDVSEKLYEIDRVVGIVFGRSEY